MPDEALERLASDARRGARRRRDAVTSRSGRYVRAEPFRAGESIRDVAADASLRAAARGALSSGGARLPCASRDLRRKVRSRPRQALIVFAVDASASMAAEERMSIAKGAAIALLRTAYLRRDRVAVVVFEQDAAWLLLEPTRSIDRARERLRALPASGATPLPAGLWTARRLIAAERLRDPQLAPTLVLLTDGQSNVPIDPMAYAPREALAVADRIRAEGVSVLVVDVVSGPASPPALVELAEHLGGRLLRVARGDAFAVAAAVRSS